MIENLTLNFRYYYPQKLLCKQFWTYNQQLQFNEAKLLKKFEIHDRLLINLKQTIDSKLSNKDSYAKNVSIDLIGKVMTKNYYYKANCM